MAKDDPQTMAERTAAIVELSGDWEDEFTTPKIEDTTKPRFRGRSHLDMVNWLIERHGRDLKFVNDRENGHTNSQSWAVWNGQIWLIGADAASVVSGWIDRMADDLRDDFKEWIREEVESGGLAELNTEDFSRPFQDNKALESEVASAKKYLMKTRPDIVAFWDFCKKMRDHWFTSGLMAKLKTDQRIQASISLFDQDLYLMTMANGLTVDVRGKDELRYGHDQFVFAPRREDYVTKQLDYNYDATAGCPKFIESMQQWQPNEEKRAFLFRLMGLCLTGNVNDQVIPFIYGPPQSGKSVWSSLMRMLVGPYATKINVESLMMTARNGGGPNDDMASLFGARLALTDEPGETRTLNAGFLKDVTGGSGATFSANAKYKARMVFSQTHKLIMTTNHKPNIKDSSNAVFRRVIIFGFDEVVRVPNRGLIDDLRKELPGILNLVIKGCQEWVAMGLNPPESVSVATTRYQQEQDIIGLFYATCFDFAPQYANPVSEIYQAFVKHCAECGEKNPISKRALGFEHDKTRIIDGVEYAGFESFKERGVAYRRGLALKEEYRRTPGDEFEG